MIYETTIHPEESMPVAVMVHFSINPGCPSVWKGGRFITREVPRYIEIDWIEDIAGNVIKDSPEEDRILGEIARYIFD